MLTCESVGTLSGAYALDLLPDEEAAAIAVHVASCVACGERTRARQQTGEWLAHLVTPTPIPDGLRHRLQLRLQDQGPRHIRATAPLLPPTPDKAAPQRMTPWLWLLAGILALSLGWNLRLLGQTASLQDAKTVAEAARSPLLQRLRHQAKAAPAPASRSSLLQGARHHATASGSLALQLESRRWTLTVQGLPALPAGQVYQLWAGSGDRPAPVVAFRAGAGMAPVPVPAHAALRPGAPLLVTIEAGAGHDRPQGDLVLLGMVADS
jgi:hypothetical protein